jgi:hypothetical protein
MLKIQFKCEPWIFIDLRSGADPPQPIHFLELIVQRTYGGKVRPCLCTCPFVPVCPFVPENQPVRDQGQFETKIRNLVEHFAENFRLG